jgi:hypothetical protein
VVTKRLPPVDVAQVQLHKGKSHGQQSIPQGDGGVGVSAGIDQEALSLTPGRVDPIHQSAFVIALETVERHAQLSGQPAQISLDPRQGGAAVEARLPQTQQIEVGAIEQENAKHRE